MNDELYAIRVIDIPGSIDTGQSKEEAIGAYFRDLDVDAYDGRGNVTLTLNVADAMFFESPFAAHEFWRRQSTVRPLRDDGKPNRPGTAYTIEVDSVWSRLDGQHRT